MASVSSFNDSLWRASISDRPRHKNAKQIYYPKEHFTKRQAEHSANALEYRHKDGNDEFDLWRVDINFNSDKIILRQLEGTSSMKIRDIYNQWIEVKKREVSTGTIETYTYLFGKMVSEVGNFIPDKVSQKKLQSYVNEGRIGHRKIKKSLVNQLLDFAENTYNIQAGRVEIQSTSAERKEVSSKVFKDFLTEYQALHLANELINRPRNGNSYDSLMFSYYFLLLFYFPRRRSDFIHIKPEWIRGEVITIGDDEYLPKSQMQELVTPTDEALELLSVVNKKYGKPGKRLFPFAANYATTVFRRTIKEVYPDLLYKVTLHKLRDSGILYLMYEKNMNTQDVMSITGHESLASLQKYIHRSAKALIQQRKEQFNVKRMLKLKNKFFQRPDS